MSDGAAAAEEVDTYVESVKPTEGFPTPLTDI